MGRGCPRSSRRPGTPLAALKTVCGLPPGAGEARPFASCSQGRRQAAELPASSRRRAGGEQLRRAARRPGTISRSLTIWGCRQPLAEKLGYGRPRGVERGLIALVTPPAGSGLSTHVRSRRADQPIGCSGTSSRSKMPRGRRGRSRTSSRCHSTPARASRRARGTRGQCCGRIPGDRHPRRPGSRPGHEARRTRRREPVRGHEPQGHSRERCRGRSRNLLASACHRERSSRTLVGALAQRLVRKLCPKCREEYPPPPELLARLKLNVDQLHLRKPSEHGCRLCGGTGYLGRAAIFELAIGPTVRKAFAAGTDAATFVRRPCRTA